MPLHLILNGVTHAIEIIRRKPNLVLDVDGRCHEVVKWSGDALSELVTQDARTSIARALTYEGSREMCFVRIDGRTHEIGLIDPREELAGHDSTRDEIHAPMPGAIISIHKQAGESVARGETIITIESMKLQMALVAPRDGRISRILKGTADTFDKDETLALLVPVDEV